MYPSEKSIALARSGVTVVGAMRKSYFFAFMPGMSAENSVPSMVIGRPMRRARSFARSMLKPSRPPPALGMACGAKVASMPVRIGCCASAALLERRRAARRNDRIITLPEKKSNAAVHAVERLAHHLLVPATVPFLRIRLDAGKHVGAGAVLLAQAPGAELAHLGEERFHIEQLQLPVLHHHLSAHDDRVDVGPHGTLHECLDDVGARIEPRLVFHPVEIDQHGVGLHSGHEGPGLALEAAHAGAV